MRSCAGLLMLLAALVAPEAVNAADPVPNLAAEAPMDEVFPDASRFGPMTGSPPAAEAFTGDALAGYVFSTQMVVASAGYSGKPFDILAGIDLEGRITGAAILAHSEPILVIGVADSDLAAFVAQYRGLDIREPLRVARRGGSGPGQVDAVAGASISSVVFNDAILRAARAVARSRGILGQAQAGLDFESFDPATWQELSDEGSLVSLDVTVADAEAAIGAEGGKLFPDTARPDPDARYLSLHAGLATPARVGRNLLGDRLYNRVTAELSEGEQLVFVGGQGLFSFKGTAYVRRGVFDRLQLVQGAKTVTFLKEDHVRVEELAVEAAPALRELALFIVRSTDFSPTEPWRLEVAVTGEDSRGDAVQAIFALPYSLPATYRRVGDQAPVETWEGAPLWRQTWLERWSDIAILALALFLLTAILVFQDVVAAKPRLYETLRNGFLIFTLVWLGWIVGAQLSVLNVLTFVNAVMTEFSWDFFLLDPLMFILWSYVAVAMLFLGRGVFCGWLCPFGALQELINRGAQWLGVPQWRLPFFLHERLWPIKYVVFLAIFAVFLGDLSLALRGAEVEPFKTAIVLRFDRPWPYLLYAAVLLVAGLFVSRAFCRYLCPLGAALAIPARMRMFEWLKRRWHCGKSCHHCTASCPVQAIHPTGQINPNECIYCLRCQANYFDDQLCPPLIEQRRRAEKRAAAEKTAASPGSAG